MTDKQKEQLDRKRKYQREYWRRKRREQREAREQLALIQPEPEKPPYKPPTTCKNTGYEERLKLYGYTIPESET